LSVLLSFSRGEVEGRFSRADTLGHWPQCQLFAAADPDPAAGYRAAEPLRRVSRAPPICEANAAQPHAIRAQPMGRCAPQRARTANKQMSLIVRSAWKYERFLRAAMPAVIVHNGMALA
jgi:hypothetical protein